MTFESDPTKVEQLKKDTIEAVKEGRALPLPEFAAEEGGEMMVALESEIEKLDAEQLSQFYDALKEAELAKNTEVLKEAFAHSTSLLSHTNLMALVIPMFFGTYLSGGNPLVGMLATGGAVVALKAIRVSNWTEEEKAATKEKAKRVERLIEQVQKRREERM